uniref:Class I SAM-dependent methyltransferase n=1 Tax=candidate division WOR-3 bacterium TaxID=2052148 RepID=A0A7C4TFS9_UNCW3
MEKSRWDRFWAKRKTEEIYPPVTDIVEELKRTTQISDKKILEAGAGTGRDGIRLSEEGADVYLLDYSWESLNLIREYLKRNTSNKKWKRIKLILADALNTPFKEGEFDIVFHQGLLEHFSKPDPLLKENYRILKEGGILLVDVPQTLHIYTILKQILIFLGIWFGDWERQFTIESLTRLLKRYRFKLLHFYGDWSRPGVLYKILREVLKKFKIELPMYPKYLGKLTQQFYLWQRELRKKRLFLYTVLSIGVVARKVKF